MFGMAMPAAATEPNTVQAGASPNELHAAAGGPAVDLSLSFYMGMDHVHEIEVSSITFRCFLTVWDFRHEGAGMTLFLRDPATGSWDSGHTSATGEFTVRLSDKIKLNLFGTTQFTVPIRLSFSNASWNGWWQIVAAVKDHVAVDSAGNPVTARLEPRGVGSVEVTGAANSYHPWSPDPKKKPTGPAKPKPSTIQEPSPTPAAVVPSPAPQPSTFDSPSPSTVDLAEPMLAAQTSDTMVTTLGLAGGIAALGGATVLVLRWRRRREQAPAQ
ncbi:hypothetical protein Rhe02_04380 [Rhizocola hellebori]|uniref:Uncharacterized protein n=1 Tax=Rhizocola hellebori TaxID=1392758 RepID=A0A8J3Q2D9_9ACTN|nr:hypothetical protein [Rhizocola hellebori]GIH02371.1 hypothetical protein Rhe02_04380 [Rhizocola hellebori]